MGEELLVKANLGDAYYICCYASRVTEPGEHNEHPGGKGNQFLAITFCDEDPYRVCANKIEEKKKKNQEWVWGKAAEEKEKIATHLLSSIYIYIQKKYQKAYIYILCDIPYTVSNVLFQDDYLNCSCHLTCYGIWRIWG